MKLDKLLACTFAFVLVSSLVFPAYAVPFQGTPSPALSPIFGTLIDFDDQATGTTVGAQDYVAQGIASITETRGGIGPLLRLSSSQSQPNYVSTCIGAACDDGGVSGGQDGTILIECIGQASKVGIGIANARGTDTLNIFDANMQLLETQVAPQGTNVYAGFDRQGVKEIKFLEIVGDFFAIDDLQHDCEQVFIGGELLPLDTTALLLAGMQTNLAWIIPVLSAAGIGVFIIRRK